MGPSINPGWLRTWYIQNLFPRIFSKADLSIGLLYPSILTKCQALTSSFFSSIFIYKDKNEWVKSFVATITANQNKIRISFKFWKRNKRKEKVTEESGSLLAEKPHVIVWVKELNDKVNVCLKSKKTKGKQKLVVW